MLSLHDFVYCSGVATIAAVGAAAVVTTFLVSPLAAGMFIASGLTYALRGLPRTRNGQA